MKSKNDIDVSRKLYEIFGILLDKDKTTVSLNVLKIILKQNELADFQKDILRNIITLSRKDSVTASLLTQNLLTINELSEATKLTLFDPLLLIVNYLLSSQRNDNTISIQEAYKRLSQDNEHGMERPI